jgi:chromosome partitioning protein
MRILGIVNQKGGCGKTTTAINLGACLAERGKRILLVDMDPQGHATAGLNAQNLSVEVDLRSALLKLYEEPISLAQTAALLEPNLHVVPSLISLVALEQELAGAMDRDRRLRDLIERGRTSYDYILIDSPPNLGILTVNVLGASQEIVIPVDTGMFSVYGLRRLFQVIELVQERMGLTPSVRILLTLYDPRVRLAKTILAEMEEHFPEKLLQTRIRSNIHLKEAQSYGLPILRHRPNSLGCWDYEALAEEVIAEESQMAQIESREIPLEPSFRRAPAEPYAETGSREILFHMIAPEAGSVDVVGEFNNWKADIGPSLRKGEDGVWRGRARLNPGNYQYKYLIDGKWVLDSGNPLRVVTESGVVNSLIQVK